MGDAQSEFEGKMQPGEACTEIASGMVRYGIFRCVLSSSARELGMYPMQA